MSLLSLLFEWRGPSIAQDGAPPVVTPLFDDAPQTTTAATEAKTGTEVDWTAFARSLPFGPDLQVGEATLFDLESGQAVQSFRQYDDLLRHVRFSPDGSQALLGFYYKSVLWSIVTNEAVHEFDVGGIAHFSEDGSSVLIYDKHTANRYEAATGKLLETVQLTPGGREFKSRYTRNNAHIANEVQYDASGELIYSVKSTAYGPILDAATGRMVGLCPSNTEPCFVSGATKTVLHGGPLRPFNIVRVFDFERKEIARFKMPSDKESGTSGQLKAVSSDGRHFLWAGPWHQRRGDSDSIARYRWRRYSLHDAQTGDETKDLGEFEEDYAARFSPNGARVVLLPNFAHKADVPLDPEILVIDVADATVESRIYIGPWALPSADFDESGNKLLVGKAINVMFLRRFGEWRQLEQQQPISQKVVDTLQIIKDWQAANGSQ